MCLCDNCQFCVAVWLYCVNVLKQQNNKKPESELINGYEKEEIKDFVVDTI